MKEELLLHLADELRKHVAGDISFDSITRTLYSTDASIYQIQPLGVVLPRTQDDLIAAVEIAAAHQVPILPRGSGSSLAGQTVGPALVIDCSRYLNRIRNIDPASKTAIVEPGVVLNTFNKEAGRYGLRYGPDPASSDRATFGGMSGNNSTGAHSIHYGMTADNVGRMDVILADGTPARFEQVPLETAGHIAEKEGLEGEIYARALHIRQEYADLIKDRWPRTWRRSSGYSLNYLLGYSPTAPPNWGSGAYPPQEAGYINLAPMLVGSEGTLAVFRQIEISLVEVPVNTILGVLSFESIAQACDAAPGLLQKDPSAVELIPRALIHRARSVPAYAAKLSFVRGDPAALLVVEFSGDDSDKLLEQVRSLGADVVIAESQADQDQIWGVRKVGLGLLMSRPGDLKPLPFVEDVAVPVEVLGEFVREFEKIMDAYGTHGDFYAHASSGCLHIRPLINLKEPRGVETMRGITGDVVDLTLKLGGALSGEHGDGLARSEWLEAVYGVELTQAFRELKQAADPAGILNPGKIVDPPPMHQNLRYTPEYKTQPWIPILDFSSQENLVGAIEMCNGAGVCRQQGGVMCPSFQATGEEMHSTRGRANLLRALISGKFPVEKLAQSAVFEALDLCLECKGCKAECPSGVDMAKLKYEFLHEYYSTRRRPLRDYIFGNIDTFARLGKPFGGIANFALQNSILRGLGESLFGIARERKLPGFSKIASSGVEDYHVETVVEEVIFLGDAFSQHFYPELEMQARHALHLAGCKMNSVPLVGAGRTLISKGFLKQAKRHARAVVDAIAEIDPLGKMSIVGLEPSELFTLRDEYLDFFPDDDQVTSLAARSFLIDEFLVRPRIGEELPRINGAIERIGSTGGGKMVHLHGHCYQKSQPPASDGYPSGVEATLAFLEALGYSPQLIEAGCCGMAGSFGYEAEHYEISMQIGELHLFPAVRSVEDGDIIAATGVSCRAQIESGTGKMPIHPVALLGK